MRKLSNIEISQVSGASNGSTFATSVGGTLGTAAGAAIGTRLGHPLAGAAIGGGLGSMAGEGIYNAGRDAANAWKPGTFPGGFGGSSFFPQTPSSNPS
ncbi:hypothetical protein D3C86_920810 [compost metagenome]